MIELKRMTKLQRYAASLVSDKENDIIQAHGTNSVYYNFNGNRVRISDHLPAEKNVETYGMALSIISTEDDNAFVLQRECSGYLTVITYRRAQEILRSFVSISNILKRPESNFHLEQEFYDKGTYINNIPANMFNENERRKIMNIINNVKQRIGSGQIKEEMKSKKMAKI